ncbi:hypothetical protein SEA_FRANCOIS_48 [Gordonia phage Francois]|nr:hypothetical protein SEA_FRANCOIS_48 [Gordonia phage Francois]
MTDNTKAADTAADTDTDTDIDGSVTDFASILLQHNKGREHLDASKALNDVVQAALATGKKGGYVTVKVAAEPIDSGAVRLSTTVTSKPAVDPAASIWFTDGDGNLSRDNAGMFYGK